MGGRESGDPANALATGGEGRGEPAGIVTLRETKAAQVGGRWLHFLGRRRWVVATEPDTGALVMAATGGALGLDQITRLVGRYMRKSGVANAGSCHAFRHGRGSGRGSVVTFPSSPPVGGGD